MKKVITGLKSAVVVGSVLLAGCGTAAAPGTSSSSNSTSVPLTRSTGTDATSSAVAASPAPSPVSGGGLAIQPLPQRVKVNLAVALSNPNNLPLVLAISNGAFDMAGLDLQVTNVAGSASAILPQLANNQVDIAGVVPAPNLYAQAAQGFEAKLVVGMDVQKAGRASAGQLLVQKGEESSITTFADLKGKVVEGSVEGSPLSLLALSAIQAGGLTPGKDVTLKYDVKQVGDFLVLMQNKAADVYGAAEPFATQAADQGYAVKWKAIPDVMPWYQAGSIGVSSKFLSANRDAVEKFVEVYLQAARQVDQTNGEWTEPLLALETKNTGLDAQTIRNQGGVPYFDPNGAVAIDSLSKTQDFWVTQNLVKQKVDLASLVDESIVHDAVSRLGKAE